MKKLFLRLIFICYELDIIHNKHIIFSVFLLKYICFPQASSSIDIEWIVNHTRRFYNCLPGRIRHLIKRAYDKIIKYILRIQIVIFVYIEFGKLKLVSENRF